MITNAPTIKSSTKGNILFCSVIIIRQASPISIIIHSEPLELAEQKRQKTLLTRQLGFFFGKTAVCAKRIKCFQYFHVRVCLCGVMKRNENSWLKINYVTGVPDGCE